jgi:hypothetical protein
LKALKSFKKAVLEKSFPNKNEIVEINENEFNEFLNLISK